MKQETNFPDLLTAQEARKLLRLGKNAIYDLARERKLEYVRIGGRILFPRAGIEEFIRANTVSPKRDFFSVNRRGFRKNPGHRTIIEQPDEITEKRNQDCSHFAPPDENLSPDLVNVNPKKMGS
jgi:excisionase family DNA binding protein